MRAPARARRPPRRSSPLALLRSGRFVQAFPEYGPERRGAPLRAYTRSADRPIRRHDAVEHPDVVVVLEPSLARRSGRDRRSRRGRPRARQRRAEPVGLAWRRASLACPRPSSRANAAPASSTSTMLGAVAAALGEPPLRRSRTLPSRCSARKVDRDRRAATRSRGGVPMPSLKPWSDCRTRGAVDAPTRAAGDGRLAHRPQAGGRVLGCVNCLLCWIYCPDSAVRLDGTTFDGFDLDALQGLRDLRRDLPGRTRS